MADDGDGTLDEVDEPLPDGDDQPSAEDVMGEAEASLEVDAAIEATMSEAAMGADLSDAFGEGDAGAVEGTMSEAAMAAEPSEAFLEGPTDPGGAADGEGSFGEAAGASGGDGDLAGGESVQEGGDGDGEDAGFVGSAAGSRRGTTKSLGGGSAAGGESPLAGSQEGDGEEGQDMDEEELDEDKPDRLQELQEKYDQLLELNERALQHNVALQRRVIQRRMQDKSYDASDKQSEGKVTEHKYQNVLHNVHTVRLQLRLQQVKAARMSEELKNQLETKRQKAIECRDSFQEFKRQVARHAEYARTGKKIAEKIIQEVEEFELDKDAEVEEVRGSNISLKNRLAKLEQALRKKDELAENLHVIDFEQLKIENQTLNEKIEERNEELHKLRKKTIVTVQIITHMREKVQFVQRDYQSLKAELSQLDQDLAAQRDLVAKTKHERDEHRAEYGKLRQQTGIMNSEHLTRDFEARAEHIKQLKDEISQLKRRHQQMLQFIKGHGGTM